MPVASSLFTSINILTTKSLQADVFISVKQDSRYRILGHMAYMFQTLWKLSHFPKGYSNSHSPEGPKFPALHTANRGCYQPLVRGSTGWTENQSLFAFEFAFPFPWWRLRVFSCLLASCISSFGDCLFISSAHLSIVLSFTCSLITHVPLPPVCYIHKGHRLSPPKNSVYGSQGTGCLLSMKYMISPQKQLLPKWTADMENLLRSQLDE